MLQDINADGNFRKAAVKTVVHKDMVQMVKEKLGHKEKRKREKSM